jgi:hypothetical protein
LRRSLDGAYGAITAQFHVDPFALGGQTAADEARWLEGTLDYAASQGIPILSALEWLHFTEVRHDASLESIQWQPTEQRLSFDLVAHDDRDVALAAMVPLLHGEAELAEIELDGVAVEHSVRRVGGVDYGWVSVPAGFHQVVATYG